MTWSFYLQGFPRDLDARITVARTKAELAFADAQAGRSQLERRQLLIDVRIAAEVIEWALCACEVARRGLIPVSAVEKLVDDHLRFVAREFGPDPHTHSPSSEAFVEEVVKRVKATDDWRKKYLAERQNVAELLAAAKPHEPARPSLLTWAELELRFLSDEALQFVVNGTPRAKQNYAELGFEDGRTGTPVQAWQTLLELARHEGNLEVDRSETGYEKQATRVKEIRGRLRALFSCPDDPLPLIENQYRAQFRVTRAQAFGDR